MKLASAEFEVGKKTVHIAGVCKGSGMIHPNMATMLVYLFTDLDAEPKRFAGGAESGGGYDLPCDLGRWRHFDQRYGSAAGLGGEHR